MLIDRPLYYVTVVWGELFVRQFLEATLPAYLAPGNFGSSPGTGDKYFLYTTTADAAVIRQSPVFQRVQQTIPTELRTFDPQMTMREGDRLTCWESNKVVNHFYGQTIPESVAAGAGQVILTPDHIWSDGSFANMRRILRSGKKVISMNSVLVLPGTFIPALQRFTDPSTGGIKVSHRDLVRLGIEHMHPYTLAQNAESPFYTNFSPSSFWWHVEGEGIIFHVIGGDPKVIVHPNADVPWPEGFGFEQLEHVWSLGFSEDEIHWLQESDDMVCIAFDYHKHGDKDWQLDPKLLRQPISASRTAAWLHKNISKVKQGLLRQPMRLHYNEMSNRWMEKERQTQAFVSSIFRFVEFLDANPSLGEDLNGQFAFADSTLATLEQTNAMNRMLQEPLLDPGYQNGQRLSLAQEYGMRGELDKALYYLQPVLFSETTRAIQTINDLAAKLQIMGHRDRAVALVRYCEQVIQNHAQAHPRAV